MKILSVYPMTEIQKGIAYECELHDHTNAYVSQAIIEIHYSDKERYRKCWHAILNHYEIFRTKFVFGKLNDDMQVVIDDANYTWSEHLCSIEEIEVIAKSEKDISINDLPLTKFKVLETPEGTYLVWTFHHLLLDGWSMSATLDKVDRLYESEDNIIDEKRNTLNHSYSDYIKGSLKNTMKKSDSFWENYLNDFRGAPFPNISTVNRDVFSEKSREIDISYSDIFEYCKNNKITVAALFETAWATLLSLYTQKQDVLFSVIDSGRSILEEQNDDLIGMTIQRRSKRIRFSVENTIHELLKNIMDDDLELQKQGPLSLRNENSILNVGNNTSYSNTTFVFENYPTPSMDMNYKVIKGTELSTSDITASFGIVEDIIMAKLMFHEQVVDVSQAENILSYVEEILKEIINLDSNAEAGKVLSSLRKSEIKSTTNTRISSKSYLEIIEEQVSTTPGKIAIFEEEQHHTYEDIITSCHTLIDSLSELSIKEDETVGIWTERSAQTIELMIALQYLHIPYVFLDKKYGSSRLEYIMQDANVGMVILDNTTSDEYEFTTPSITLENLFSTNVLQNRVPSYVAKNTCTQIIYTSGSTGSPKGIMVSSGNIISFALDSQFYPVNVDENFAQSSSFAFDASNFEIWLPLFNGASITIVKEPVFDIYNWNRAISEKGVTTAWMTAGLFNTFVDLDFSLISGLKTLFVGGEALSPAHINKAYQNSIDLTLYNGYGPTELTTFTTTYQIPREDAASQSIPIGYLLNNSHAQIVNTEGSVVPIGVPGELIVASSGMTMGYLNDHEKTIKAFTSKDIDGVTKTFYHTGDIVRFDGACLHYSGRKDKQIKLRGYRIELNDIEAVLNSFDGVERCATLFNDDSRTDKFIELYYVGKSTNIEVKAFLKAKLPSYMIPQKIIQLDTMPLNVNGKINKNELRATRLSKPKKLVETTSVLTDEFNTFLSEYLNNERIDDRKTIFDYDLDSLKVVKLTHVLNDKYDQKISLKAVMNCPSIAEIRGLFIGNEETQAEVSVLIDQNQINEEVVLNPTDMQRSMYFISSDNPGLPIYNIPFIQKIAVSEKLPIKKRFLNLIDRHELFRYRFELNNDKELIIKKSVHNSPSFFEVVAETEQEFIKFKNSELNYCFNLDDPNESLIRMTFIQYQDVHWIVVVIHHIIFDGESMGIFLNQLFSTNVGEENSIKQFDDYLHASPTLPSDETKQFWIESLKNVDKKINFQKSSQLPYNFAGEIVTVDIKKRFIETLNKTARSSSASKFNVLLALYSQFLIKYFNQDSMIVGSPVSIRPPAFENTLGMFLSFVPFVSYRNENQSFDEHISHTKQTLYDVVDHSNASYSDILKWSEKDATASNGLSMIQTVLNYQMVESQKLEELLVSNNDHQTAQFPISLVFYESDQSKLQIEYSTQLFNKYEIVNMMELFLEWGARVLDESNQSMIYHPVLGQQETKLLVEMNNPRFSISKKEISDFLSTISLDNHDAAIVYEGRTIKYSELHDSIEQFNVKLMKSDVGKGDKILFYGSRSTNQIILYLTCLKYGYVYVPIDRKHPYDRLVQIISECRPQFILHEGDLDLKDLNHLLRFKAADINNKEFERFNVGDAQDESLAYILYTSGTTGKPKGVKISRFNLSNFMSSLMNDYGIEGKWNAAFLSSISFDASIFEMTSNIIKGNKIVIFEEDYSTFTDFILNHQINYMVITPSLLNAYDFSKCHSLKMIVSGGEKFKKNRTLHEDVVTLNGYGPTEASVCVSYSSKESESNIGIPNSNSCVVIVDAYKNILPDGSTGEIAIVGPSTCESYVDRADNEGRIEDVPSSLAQYGQKMYLTGDLGSFQEHELHYIGRNDLQVKIRGNRVELTEISSSAVGFAGVKEAYTIYFNEEGGSELALYVVSEPKHSLWGEKQLIQYLSTQLPSYMIPTKIMKVDKMPLTVNGKVDEKQLPLPDMNHDEIDIVIAPRNEQEKMILDIWSSVLKTESIGINQNFFDLGGDSIKSIQIVSLLKEKELHISSQDILTLQTIENLSDAMTLDEHGPVEYGEKLHRFSISPIQEWFFNLNLNKVNHWNQSQSLTLPRVSEEQLLKSFEVLYEHHPMLRSSFVLTSREVKVMDVASIALENRFKRYSGIDEMNADTDSMQAGLNIYTGETSKILYCYENNEIHIFWIIHHLFVDIHSWSILENEIRQLLQGNEIQGTDHSTKQSVIAKQQQCSIMDAFDLNDDANNPLYDTKLNGQELIVKKQTLDNETQLTSTFTTSIILQTIVRLTNETLNVWLERNARFEDTLKEFNLNHTVGWMTDFKRLTLPRHATINQVFLQLNNVESHLSNVDSGGNSVFVNIVKLAGKKNDYQVDSLDIAKENLQKMPPTINVIEFDDEYRITLLNVASSDAILKASKEVIDMELNKPELINHLKIINKLNFELLDYEEFTNLGSHLEIEGVQPLFPLQEEMIYSGVSSENSYVNHFAWTTTENIDSVVFKMEGVIEKYEALRTRFVRTAKNNFIQVIDKKITSTIHKHRAHPRTLLEIDALIKEEYKTFKYQSNRHLYGFYLFELENGDTRAVLIFNHILFDGWSIGILMKELWRTDTSPILKSRSITNDEYSRWLLARRKHQDTTSFEKLRAIDNRLFSKDVQLRNPEDINIELRKTIPYENSESFMTFCKTERVSVANAMATIWGMLISKLSGSKNVLFGSVKSGRNCPVFKIEEQVGMFIHTSPTYLMIDDHQSFADLIHQIEAFNRNSDNTDTRKLKKAVGFGVNQDLYETIFIVDNYPEPNRMDHIKDIEANEQSNYPLSLSVAMDDKVHFKISYSDRLVSSDDIHLLSFWIEEVMQYVTKFDGDVLANELLGSLSINPSILETQEAVSVARIEEIEEKNEVNGTAIIEKNSFIENVKQIWRDVLGHSDFDEHSDFFEIGGNSLKMSKMLFILKEDYDYDLNPLMFFENPTLKIFGFEEELENEEEIIQNYLQEHPAESAKVSTTNHVLVTGATGLVGSELVYQLLSNDHIVYCIVRGINEYEAHIRLMKRLESISKTDVSLNLHNLRVFRGDIHQEFLGLDEETYLHLSGIVSEIYNCAGNVNFMASLKDSLETNVKGLQMIMKFSQLNLIKKVNHISTLSVLGHDHYIIEDTELAPISYVKSKVVAEKYLRQYRTTRDGVSVQRLGRIAGNDRTYSVPENDLFWRLIVSIHQLGYCPKEFLEFETDLTPVNVAVERMIAETNKNHENRVINYFSESLVTFGHCIKLLEEMSQKTIELVSYEEWMDHAENDSNLNQIKVLIPLFRQNVFYEPEENTIISENSPDVQYQSKVTLKNSISDEVIKCYLKEVLNKY
ncbi:hypothetical protein ADM98_00850 [Exiguobacterium sp. BMC-KP]|uniref:condensation domain-containing protein n=1 Tax=Exiguobacterium sp. BMC-KP TaxID=1684312 RepID=UPI0006AA4352|nr:condensation domain-containing protein [Exiguobacterium sp. BMC-KP]KOP31428.1 hypothetical protein ADM98_00850 [Exiguobacterium sp. BMC-KP]